MADERTDWAQLIRCAYGDQQIPELRSRLLSFETEAVTDLDVIDAMLYAITPEIYGTFDPGSAMRTIRRHLPSLAGVRVGRRNGVVLTLLIPYTANQAMGPRDPSWRADEAERERMAVEIAQDMVRGDAEAQGATLLEDGDVRIEWSIDGESFSWEMRREVQAG